MPISFPGLFGDWEFNPDPIAVHIGHGIYWYGIILAIGLLAGVMLASRQARRYGLTEDNVLDIVLWAVPSCIVGARLYYVIFYLDLYRNADGSLNFGEMVAVWDGGLAIYGAVIAGVIVAFFYTRHKRLKMGAMTDLAVMGLLLGQCIGRWANFINREAFGAETTLPWRMRLWTSATQYIEVHPTFFYESLWNLIGLLLILFVVSRARRFDGENTWFYFLWYGLGRFWIEGLRTDSLYLFDWTFMGEPIRVSQALSLLLALTAAVDAVLEHPHQKARPVRAAGEPGGGPGSGGGCCGACGGGRGRGGDASRGGGRCGRRGPGGAGGPPARRDGRSGDGGDGRWQCALTERPWPPR